METETLTDITENRDAAMTAVNTENPETASDQAETTELLKGENAASDCNRIGKLMFGGPRKKLCKQYLTNLDKAKITGISLT